MDAEKIGFHPCNRESQGLAPVGGQDLLLAIVVQGWLWHMVEGLASEIQPDQEGVEWRAVNARLAERSDGLLPLIPNTDVLEVMSARGSHTACAVRCS